MSDGKLQVKSDEILVVDDHSETLKTLSAIFNPDKYKVRLAQSGVQALRSVETKPPDLIILDIRMPEMGGYEVCRRLKQDKISREIPVIFLSALDEPMGKVKAFEAGGVDYITKPFNSEEVIARINTHLQLRQLQKELQKFSHSLERQVDVRTAELAESREDYGRLVENLHIGIFRSTPGRDGHFLMTNPALVKMLGFETTKELMETPVMELYQNAADRQLFFEKLLKSEFVRNKEIAIRNKTGLSLIVSVTARMIRGQDNKPLYVDGVVEDITDRKQRDERLRKAEKRYRTVADFTYDWEYWSKLDGTIEYVSPSCERISGYNVQDFKENPSLLRKIVVPEDQGILDQHICGSKRYLISQEIQFRIKSKNGNIRWIEHACQPVIDSYGNVDGFRASNRDISIRKQSEAELSDIQEKARLLATKLLTSQESERRRIARELHDDIAQRLAVLNIEVDKMEMQDKSLPKPAGKVLKRISRTIGELSSDIQMISRRLHPAVLETLGLARSIEIECNNFTRLRNVPTILDLDDGFTDLSKEISLQVYRIVQEGFRNIARHAKATSVHVTLSQNNDLLHLLIKDNGIGFDRASNTANLGLGLASMTERAHFIRGDLSIESQPGKGTAIKLTAPFK